jgi:metal-responsive CopG/Arc/MetJ family transcriptional regulator
MKACGVRLEENTLQEIDRRRGVLSRSDYIRKLIITMLQQPENAQDNTALTNVNALLTAENAHNKELVEVLKSRIKEQESMIGFLQLEHQKLLPARAWWHFWKK